MAEISDAVILVGGFGTRLRPLTLNRPKQMLPVGQRPMIEVVIEQLEKAGITDVVLALGYKPDAFIEKYPDGMCGNVCLKYVIEPEPLDTAGAIRFAVSESGLSADSFLAVNGDVLSRADLSELVETHIKTGAEATILSAQVDDPSMYGVMKIGEGNEVIDFVEKPKENIGNNINAGVYVLNSSFLKQVQPNQKVSLEKEIFPELVKEKKLFCHISDSYWLDAGTPETYLKAQIDLVAEKDLVAPSAKIDTKAEIDKSLLCEDVKVLGGAVVSHSAVFSGTTIDSDATVSNSILGANVYIGAGAVVENCCVIGDDYKVEPNTKLNGVKLPESKAT